MTPLLVLCMAVIALTAYWYTSRQRSRAAHRARNAVRFVEAAPSGAPGPDVRFHPGQTWVQVHDKGLASIGTTAFAANFAGDVAAVWVPQEGRRVRKNDLLCALVSRRGRRVELRAPIAGKVLAVNDAVLKDPTLLQTRPYDMGWILRVRPRSAAKALADLLPVSAAQRWVDAARNTVTQRLSPVPATVAFDGGEWVRGFGERLDDAEWQALSRELFGTAAAPSGKEA